MPAGVQSPENGIRTIIYFVPSHGLRGGITATLGKFLYISLHAGYEHMASYLCSFTVQIEWFLSCCSKCST